MSSRGSSSIGLAPRLVFEDAGGWRRALFTVAMFALGLAVMAVLLSPDAGYSAEAGSRAVLLMLAGFLPLGVGYRAGLRTSVVLRRPALALLPRVRRECSRSTVGLAAALVTLAALAGAATGGVASSAALSAVMFGAGAFAGRGWASRGDGAPVAEPLAHSSASSVADQGASTASLPGPARLREASRYTRSADNRWSRGRALSVLAIGAIGSIVAASIVNVISFDGGGLVARLQGLLFAPIGDGVSDVAGAGTIRSASRDLFAPLVFVPLLALTQHAGLGYLPFSRRTIASLAARHFYAFAGSAFAIVFAFGLAVVGLITWSAGAGLGERLAPYLVTAGLVVSAMPALTGLTLFGASLPSISRSKAAAGFSFRQLAWGAFVLALGFVAVQLCVALSLWLREGSADGTTVAAGAGLLFVAGAAMLPRLFRRYYAVVSLAP